MLENDTVSILVVEDEPTAHILMGRIAQRYSNFVYSAKNGKEGLEMFKKHSPSIVIADIRMPEMDGLTMIEQMSQHEGKRPIIILSTAYSEIEYFTRAIELKVDHLLVKPIEADALAEKIRRSIEIINNETENKRLKKLLEIQDKKIHTVFNFQSNIVLLSTRKGLVDVNQAFLDFFGAASLDEFKLSSGYVCDFFIKSEGFLHLDERDCKWIDMVLDDAHGEHLVKMFDKKREEERIFVIKAAQYPGEDELFIISLTDISEIENNRKLLRTLATTDKLTKIYNRFKFDEMLALEASRSRRYKNPLSMIVFDLDFFKTVNDSYSHDEGDRLLIEVASIVKLAIRNCDSFARWGGDEFAIILPNTNLQNAMLLAEKIREKVAGTEFDSHEHITLSLGVAEYDYANLENEQELLKRTDTMLYRAKANGRNTICG